MTNDDTSRQEDEHTWRQLDYNSEHTSNPTTDEGVPTADDGRGASRTGFKEWEGGDEPLETDFEDADEEWGWLLQLRNQCDSKWEWYSLLHQGVGSEMQSQHNLDADKQRCIDVICSKLECTERTNERVQWLVERMDLNDVSRNAPYEAIILATITLVANERVDGQHTARWIRREDGFDELCESLDVARSEIRSLRESVRNSEVYEETK